MAGQIGERTDAKADRSPFPHRLFSTPATLTGAHPAAPTTHSAAAVEDHTGTYNSVTAPTPPRAFDHSYTGIDPVSTSTARIDAAPTSTFPANDLAPDVDLPEQHNPAVR